MSTVAESQNGFDKQALQLAIMMASSRAPEKGSSIKMLCGGYVF